MSIFLELQIKLLEKDRLELREEIIKLKLDKEELKEQFSLQGVSQRSELYFAFMEEYNALMGKSEHQILKEEVIVLLAKYSG
mgnify:FL=1|jgi:hypothetical protein|tara:strand:- start:2446 stop:2691 length:246 start_codon:yes stop_codon:yes gene_type:complete